MNAPVNCQTSFATNPANLLAGDLSSDDSVSPTYITLRDIYARAACHSEGLREAKTFDYAWSMWCMCEYSKLLIFLGSIRNHIQWWPPR